MVKKEWIALTYFFSFISVYLGFIAYSVFQNVIDLFLPMIDVKLPYTAATYEINATLAGTNGIRNMAGFVPSVGIILAACVILALLSAVSCSKAYK